MKPFTVLEVLSVITGRLLCDIDRLYAILNHLTGDSLYTHQLGRAMKECGPWLLRWHPELQSASASLPSLDWWIKSDPTCPSGGIKMWIAELREVFPAIQATYDLDQIPRDDHDHVDPVKELEGMIGKDKIIVVDMESPS